MLLSGRSVADIRDELKKRGEFLIYHHAIDKIRQLVCSPRDVIDSVLLEELSAGDDQYTPPDQSQPLLTGYKTAARLLIIDDDPSILRLLEQCLTSRGHLCDHAGDGIDALLKLGTSAYDLILSDIRMPNLDGFRMMELLKLKGIRIPVILMSAMADSESEASARESGAADFIRKPLNGAEVASTVERILRLYPRAS